MSSTPDHLPETRARRLIVAGMALLSYIPLLLTAPGKVGADTKQYLYLDPSRLLAAAPSMWDPQVGMGTVTHQNIGYLVPMGPWYWTFQALHVPDWVAQRMWTGTILFAAGLGAFWLLRLLGLSYKGAAVAGLAYLLTPYTLEYEARISAILMPYSALPWMIGLAILALRRGGWRWPALFALVVALVGGVNATCLLYAGLAPVLWFPFAVWVDRSAKVREALWTIAKIGFLTVVCSLWWMAGLLTQAGYGLDVLRYTETVEVVSQTSLPIEVMRGLGNWYFYGRDAIGPWIEPASSYTGRLWSLAVSYTVPFLALVSAAVVRWRWRLYFVLLLFVGVGIAVGVHPYDHPSPLGGLFKAFANSSSAGLALRSVGRAVPLVAIGIAALLGAGADAAWARWAPDAPTRPRVRYALGALVVLLVANQAPLVTGKFVDVNLRRPEDIPQYWRDAANFLDAQGDSTRVLEVPGADFSHYRWGATLDPLTPGIMDRDFVGRELIPYGSPASADLLRAIDERLQEGTFEPSSLAPIARLMSAGDVVLRSDLQFERYRTPRPRPTWREIGDPRADGLGAPTLFGPVQPTNPEVAITDEITFATKPGDPDPPAVAVFPVPGAPAMVRAEAVQRPTIVAGDAEGLVDLAAAGQLPGDTGRAPILFSAAYAKDPEGLQAAIDQGAVLVVTDTNRRRGQRWGTIQDVQGYTEQAGETPLVTDPTDARLPVFEDAGDDSFTVVQQRGVKAVRATHYGNPVSYEPGHRPAAAIDGDPQTAWEVGAFDDPTGERWRLDLAAPVTTDHLTLVQPLTGARERFITKATITFDGKDPLHVDLSDPASRTDAGQTVTFPSRSFSQVEITIDAINIGKRADYSGGSGVGFAEVKVPGVAMDEVTRLPVDLLAAAGTGSASHPLLLVMTRKRTDPLESFKVDEEQAMARVFTLPTERTFALSGTLRLSGAAPDKVLDALLQRGTFYSATASASQTGNLLAHGPAAIDHDPRTAWQPPFGDQEGQFVTVHAPGAITIDHLDLQVVADGRHSVPTKLRITSGSESRDVDVPPVADGKDEQHVAAAPVSFPALTGSDFQVTITGTRKEQDVNYFSGIDQTLPVGITELGFPGSQVVVVSPAAPVCRTDLLTVDDKPVGIEIAGANAGLDGSGVNFTACGGASLDLGAGDHVVRTALGRETGINVDRIVLDSDTSTGTSAPSAAPAVTVEHQGRTSLRVKATGAKAGQPFWFVLGQSHNLGWTAKADGKDLGEPTLVDGYANGWVVTPAADGDVVIRLDWTPQHTVNLALWISAVASLACALLVAWPLLRRRRRTAPLRIAAAPVGFASWHTEGLALPWSGTAVRAVAAAVVAGLLVTPLTGVAVGIVVLAASRLRRPGALGLAGAGLFGLCALYVLQLQLRYEFPPKLDWPNHFEKIDALSWAAVILAVAGAVLDRRGDGFGA